MLKRVSVLAVVLLGLWASGAWAECYRPPSASNQRCETLPAGGNNTDASASAQSLSGLNLLGTLAANPGRAGYIIQVQDSSANCGGAGGNSGGLVVALDDGASGTATVILVGYAAAKGAQGGALDMPGVPHTGRVRYYGTAGCQVAAAQW